MSITIWYIKNKNFVAGLFESESAVDKAMDFHFRAMSHHGTPEKLSKLVKLEHWLTKQVDETNIENYIFV